jgi:CRISPR-associated protein Csm3
MEKINYKITLTVLTGLHIGAGNDNVQIGGVDSEVIKDPVTKLPYIPGSSLKGKIRCLLETEGGKGLDNDIVLKCFGQWENKKVESPTRFIFRDLKLTDECKKMFNNGELITESKSEVKINRTTGTAEKSGPRTIERVPPTVAFEGEILIRVINDDKKDDMINLLEEGIKLLNNDFLGGSGSRGYGHVKAELKKVN